MLTSQLFAQVRGALPVILRRNIGITSVVLQNDPIQKLFVEKIREYRSKSDGGKRLVDPTAEIQKELKSELERLTTQFGGKAGEDMTKFPEFNFGEAKIDPISEPVN